MEARSPIIYLVARGRQDLYDMLTQEFAGEPDVQVLVDQRRAERRRQARPASLERRVSQRRARREAELDLHSLGWALVDAC